MEGLKEFIAAITNESLPDVRNSLSKELLLRVGSALQEQQKISAENLLVTVEPEPKE